MPRRLRRRQRDHHQPTPAAGRDYIGGLRQHRTCRVLGGQSGACVWAALDAVEGTVSYWTRDRMDPDLNPRAVEQRKGQGYTATLADRAVSTMRLQGVLDHFAVKHVDYMSVDW